MIMATALLLSLSGKAQVAVVSNSDSKKYDVGEIPVEYSLTPSGAVSYTIPIDVHPDTEEFQPHLSFMYNSQQRETALGYGWNISGLSGITHVSGSIYYDGKATPLSLQDDKLMLDGMRLIKTGTGTWQSEQGFIRVNRESESRLKVHYPDGNTAVFENSPQAPFSYVMTSYTNRKGRTIQYTYMQADNLPYIRTIRYGEAQGVYNDSIVFNYRNIPNGITRYADGKSFKYSKLLETVSSFYKGNLWRRYRISYQNSGVYLPDSLECETSHHRRLSPLRFGYGDGRSIEFLSDHTHYLSKYFHNSQQGQTGYSSLVISRGKFSKTSNSDGLITYPIPNQGEYHETQELLVYKDLSDQFIEPVVFTAGKGFRQLEAVDIDGDGVDELVKINYIKKKKLILPVIQKDTLKVTVYDSQINPARHKDYAYPEQEGYVHERQCIFGDFNGDGKIELLAISSCYNPDHDKYPSRALLVDLDSRKVLYDNECFDFTFYQVDSRALYADRLIPMDYNGDGKTDICLINVNGTYVYEFTGNGFKQLAYSNDINIMHFNFEGSNNRDRELMLADMNADGNIDIILGPRRVHCKDLI